MLVIDLHGLNHFSWWDRERERETDLHIFFAINCFRLWSCICQVITEVHTIKKKSYYRSWHWGNIKVVVMYWLQWVILFEIRLESGDDMKRVPLSREARNMVSTILCSQGQRSYQWACIDRSQGDTRFICLLTMDGMVPLSPLKPLVSAQKRK